MRPSVVRSWVWSWPCSDPEHEDERRTLGCLNCPKSGVRALGACRVQHGSYPAATRWFLHSSGVNRPQTSPTAFHSIHISSQGFLRPFPTFASRVTTGFPRFHPLAARAGVGSGRPGCRRTIRQWLMAQCLNEIPYTRLHRQISRAARAEKPARHTSQVHDSNAGEMAKHSTARAAGRRSTGG